MADTYFYGVRESAAGAAKRHLCVFNPVGSGKVMTVYSIVAAGAPAAAVAGLTISLVCLRVTAAPTGGSTVVECKAVSSSVASPMSAMAAATGGATEPASVSPFGSGAVSGEETATSTESVLYSAPLDGSMPVTLTAGEGFLVKQGTLASAGNVNIVAKVAVA